MALNTVFIECLLAFFDQMKVVAWVAILIYLDILHKARLFVIFYCLQAFQSHLLAWHIYIVAIIKAKVTWNIVLDFE